MPKIIVVVTEEQKGLWVGAAHDERLSLSEWVRRRCDGGLAAGVPGSEPGRAGRATESRPSPTPAASREDAESEARSLLTGTRKKCSREARHHTNHGGRPCPECGWPNG